MKSLNQLGRWIRGLTPAGRRKNAAPRIHPAHAAYMNDLRESQLAQTIPGTLVVLYLVAAILVCGLDRKSTRLNSSHTVIYTLSLHDALPICPRRLHERPARVAACANDPRHPGRAVSGRGDSRLRSRSEEHTSELQSHSDLHSFPTRRSSDLPTPLT